jgi:hypothetical protein
MARLTLYLIAFALGAAAAVGLVSCGGSDDGLLRGSDAEQILDNLDTVEDLVAAGDCDGAVSAAQDVRNQVERLPQSVDGELRQRLEDGAVRLEEVAATDCEEPTTVTETTTPPEEETDTEETEPTETEPTETAPTETQPTGPTTPTETTPTTPTTTPTDGEDGGNGDSGGIGPSGTSGFEGDSG